MLIALIGVAIGLALGARLPFLAVWLGGSLLPIPIEPVMAPAELLLAALYGALIALAFAHRAARPRPRRAGGRPLPRHR